MALCAGLLAPQTALAQRSAEFEKKNPKVLAAFHDVVAGPSYSTVRIMTTGKEGKPEEVALGTVVGPDGWIITKATELKSRPVLCKFKDGRELAAKVVGIHDPYDLALLKVEAKDLKPVVWGETKAAVPGNWVAAPGLASEPVAVGVVSVAARKVGARDLPLSNAGFLGVQLEPGEKGAKITRVEPKSAAEKAGLKANDVVIGVADKIITDPDTMIETITRYKPGESVVIRIRREDKEVEVKATLDKRPSDGRSDFQNRLGGALSDRRGGFPKVLQHDTVLKPDQCGGPLVDLDSKTIGINIARAGRTETYAIPAEEVVALLPDLKAGKYAPKETAPPKTETEDVRTAKEKLLKLEKELADAEKKAADLKKRVEDARSQLKELEKPKDDKKPE
jgi:serine protease Do